MVRSLVATFLAYGAATAWAGEVQKEEEGQLSEFIQGSVEVVSPNAGFHWLESPLWSEEGKFLLFSDVKWRDASGATTGMIWKYEEGKGVTEFLPRAGVVGPGSLPANLSLLAEAGPNGMVWSWGGYPKLLLCQHGMKRIVEFSIEDVVNRSIAASKVRVVDSFEGEPLNSPNDLVVYGRNALFTDPPFGLQHHGDQGLEPAYGRATQPNTGVYALSVDKSAKPRLILDSHFRPNGIAVSNAGKVFIAHTDFEQPGYSVYDFEDGMAPMLDAASAVRFNMTHRIDPKVNSGLPPLADGMTAYRDIVFASGPGGVYVLNGATGAELAFLRIDDLVSNVEVGNGFLWISANQRLLRAKLVGDVAMSPARAASAPLLAAASLASLLATM